MTDETSQTTFERERKEYIKLNKMQKGYNWEIVIIPSSGNFLLDSDLDRLKSRDKLMRENYGSNMKGGEEKE